MHQVVSDKVQACLIMGIDPAELSRIDGQKGRLRTLAKSRHKNAYYFKLPDGGIYLGNFEGAYQGDGVIIPSKPYGRQLRKIELKTSHQLQRVRQVLSEQEREQVHKKKSELASIIWNHSSPVDRWNLHPYLKRKQVNATATIREIDSVRLEQIMTDFDKDEPLVYLRGRLLVFPIQNKDHISSIQFIDQSGQKRFLKDARKEGCFWQTHRCEKPSVIAIAEGMATILSVIQHAQIEMMGISGLDCFNLIELVKDPPDSWTEAREIIIFGDSDEAGIAKAKEAVCILEEKGFNVHPLIPEFTEEDIGLFKELTHSDKCPSDWNDYYIVNDALDAIRNSGDGHEGE